MAEYIKREALREILNGWRDAHADVDDVHGCGLLEDVICEVDAQTAADVAPVVHGRWIGAPLCGNDNCRCSECGSWHNIHANLRGEIMQKYCPNCGAKMDGGDNDAAD